MFSMVIKWGKAEKNPVKEVDFFRENVIKERILSEEEKSRLVSACSEHLKRIVITALNTGMRLSEILNLKWENVDIINGFITIESATSKSKKTKKIPMNSIMDTTLRNIPRKGDFVFSGEEPLGSVRKSFTSALRRAGIKGCRFHDLRHTFASNLVSAGVDIVTVSQLLGHSSIQTTMRYAHPTTKTKLRAVELLCGKESAENGHYLDTKEDLAEK